MRLTRTFALSTAVAVSTVMLATAAAAAPTAEQELFVVAQDGSAYGLLSDVVAASASATFKQLGSFPFDDEQPDSLRVTAVDRDPATGDAIALLTLESAGDYACFFVRIDEETGEASEQIVPLVEVDTNNLFISDEPCTALDIFPGEFFAQDATLQGMSSLQPADAAEPIAILGTADGLLWFVGLNTGGAGGMDSVDGGPELPLEALALIVFEGSPAFLLLAYGGSLVAWLGGIGEFTQLDDLVPGPIVGLDVTDQQVAWFTWIDASGPEPVTRLSSLDLTGIDEEPDNIAPNAVLTPASDVEYGSITLGGASLLVEAITVVPTGFGETAGDEELADTGSDSAVITTLGLIAAVLGGLGLLLLALRLALRRRVR